MPRIAELRSNRDLLRITKYLIRSKKDLLRCPFRKTKKNLLRCLFRKT